MKTIVITGASDGIGAAAAGRLHRDGHRIVLVGRSPQKTEAVARELRADHFIADFTRLADVRTLAAELDASYPNIDVLANNAGGIFGDRSKTIDGFEKTFQVNHLAPFLLTTLLRDKLIASSASVMKHFYRSRLGRALMSSPDQGADQLVWLATAAPGSEWQSGLYYEKRKPARRNNPQALDQDLARKLWVRSAALVDESIR